MALGPTYQPNATLEYSNTMDTANVDKSNTSSSTSTSSATETPTKTFKEKLVQLANEISVKTYQ